MGRWAESARRCRPSRRPRAESIGGFGAVGPPVMGLTWRYFEPVTGVQTSWHFNWEGAPPEELVYVTYPTAVAYSENQFPPGGSALVNVRVKYGNNYGPWMPGALVG